MDLAAPVHVRRRRHEPQDHALGGAGVCIFLGVHGLDDVFADLDPGQRVVTRFDFRGRHGLKLRYGDGLAALADGHEDHHALAAHRGRAALGISRGNNRADVHRGPSRVDDGGLDVDHVAAVDRIGKVDIAHVCRDAIGLRPSDGRRVRCLIHPFEDSPGVHGTAVADIRGGRQEAQGHSIRTGFAHAESLLTGGGQAR